MTTIITPGMLRLAQTYLTKHTRYTRPEQDRLGLAEHMCNAMALVAPSTESDFSFDGMLLNAGVPTLCGDLGMGRYTYARTAQPVRFMLLEFLALYLEDTQGSNSRAIAV